MSYLGSSGSTIYGIGMRSLRDLANSSLTGPIMGKANILSGLESGIPGEITPLHDEIRTTIDISGFEILTPGRVVENEKRVDVDMIAMNGDITKNVTREAFLASWGQFFRNWKDFFAANQTTVQLLVKGTGPAWRETESYRAQLVNWLDALKREVPGLVPTLAAVSEPGKATIPDPKKPEGWSTTTIVLLTLLGAGVLAVGAFLTYRGYRTVRGEFAAKKAKRSSALTSGDPPAIVAPPVSTEGGAS